MNKYTLWNRTNSKPDAATVATAAVGLDDDNEQDHVVRNHRRVQKMGTSFRAHVRNNSICLLAYYLKCLTALLTYQENHAIFGHDRVKLTDYKQAHKLSQEDQDRIVHLATHVLAPDCVMGKLIVRDTSRIVRGWMSNEFFYIVNDQTPKENHNSVNTKTTPSILRIWNGRQDRVMEISSEPTVSLGGCPPRQVQRVMIYRQAWLQSNYYNPMAKLARRRRQKIPDCIIGVTNEQAL